jgi:hypothetical protein
VIRGHGHVEHGVGLLGERDQRGRVDRVQRDALDVRVLKARATATDHAYPVTRLGE